MPELQPGDPRRLGSYELLERLGEGGQGVVYLGRDASGAQAAIKLLRADLAADASARNRFVREAQAAKQVARFCTAQVLEADVAGDQPYIASEYVPGKSLHKQVLEDGPITGAALERLGIGTLTALVAIHQAGIVHRDFKPHNVIMAPDGPRVIDFGIARALDTSQTGATKAIGTPSYMAPEQVAGSTLTEAVDVWAWATTMAFAATGHPPFGDDTVVAVINRVMNEPPSLEDLPPDLHRLLAAALVKEPERRPTAQQLMMTLIGAGPAAQTQMDDPTQATAMLGQGANMAAGPTRATGGTQPVDRTRAMGPVGMPPGPPMPPAQYGRPDPRRSGGYQDWEPEKKSRWPIVAAVGAIAALALVVGLVMFNTGDDGPGGDVTPPPASTSVSPTDEETEENDPTPETTRSRPRETEPELPTTRPTRPTTPTTEPSTPDETPTTPTEPTTPPDGETPPAGDGGGGGRDEE
ncbi:serine/threonine-protein kinase [Spirillospora sp. NPDC029432]|uniref:serine/threonine-protein kinase n=1 Tax=Spirillospora sp. NPDC029432 TaxID=3154599 RepID=UPI0034528AC1